ncbi:MAG: Ig-like domain-containing protein, partial [Verrucomicrobiae bacterium]|nr:Ig-like domain-containing protein [Verrucomicrobiae bacterium]
TYSIYLRVASGREQLVRLDRVVGDASTPNQTLLPLGYFVVPSLPGYSYVALTDVSGKPVRVSLSGVTTLRLTALGSSNPSSQLNYLMLIPVIETRSAYVSSVSPAKNAVDVPVDATIEATIVPGSAQVPTQNVRLAFNGTDVSGAVTVTAVGEGLVVRYDPPGTLPLNTEHRVDLTFTDGQGTPFAVSWSFTTVPFPRVITSVVEVGGDDSANTPAQFTGQEFYHPNLGRITVGSFKEDVPAFRDRVHQWNGATAALPLPSYLVGGDYIMIRNDNRDNSPFQLDVTVAEPALVFLLVDNRLSDGDAASPPDFSTGLMSWLMDEGWRAVRTGYNRLGMLHLPDEIGVDESGDGVGPGASIDNYSSVYVKRVPAGTVTLYQADNSGRNMYGVVVKGVATHRFAPEVAITSPAPGSSFPTTPVSIQITASATVENSTITKVEFYEGLGNKIGEVTSPPYTLCLL